MKLIAIAQQLTGSYGTVTAGQEFDCPDDIAKQLLAMGSVRKALPPRVRYETKVIVPEAPEVGPRLPFRDLPLPYSKQTPVVTESDLLLSEADLPEPGVVDTSGRRRRK